MIVNPFVLLLFPPPGGRRLLGNGAALICRKRLCSGPPARQPAKPPGFCLLCCERWRNLPRRDIDHKLRQLVWVARALGCLAHVRDHASTRWSFQGVSIGLDFKLTHYPRCRRKGQRRAGPPSVSPRLLRGFPDRSGRQQYRGRLSRRAHAQRAVSEDHVLRQQAVPEPRACGGQPRRWTVPRLFPRARPLIQAG